MTATYVKRFVIGHVAVLMHIANEDLSARIGQWLSDFEVERFDENDEENAIVVVIRGLRRGEPIPYKIPAGVEAHHESEAASYYRGDGLWIVAGKNGGAAFVDRSRKTIGMYVDSENVKTSQGALEHAMHPLFELLRQQGLYICHAGGVADGAYGLLLPGKSGQGKSTLSVDLMSGGLAYLSDDRVFLRETDRGFEMIGFYEPARLFASNVSHLPGLADGARPSIWGVVLGSRPLLVFAACGAVFHLANASMLGLVGQKLAQANLGQGIALTAASAIAARSPISSPKKLGGQFRMLPNSSTSSGLMRDAPCASRAK